MGNLSSNPRPVLWCFIAKPVYGGCGAVERSRMVPLSTAFLAKKAGWAVIGPDPDDEVALAAWERAHAPFNGIRLP